MYCFSTLTQYINASIIVWGHIICKAKAESDQKPGWSLKYIHRTNKLVLKQSQDWGLSKMKQKTLLRSEDSFFLSLESSYKWYLSYDYFWNKPIVVHIYQFCKSRYMSLFSSMFRCHTILFLEIILRWYLYTNIKKISEENIFQYYILFSRTTIKDYQFFFFE